MTTAELTAEIDSLSVTERKRVSSFIASLKKNRISHPATKKYTKSEIISIVKRSHKQASEGKAISAYKSLAETRSKYGISN